MVVEVDDRVGTDVGAAHCAIFAFLRSLSWWWRESIDDWPAGATIGGLAIPSMPDLARMRRERFERLQEQLDAQGIDGLVLLGSSSVAYARVPRSRGRTATAPRCSARLPLW